MDTQVRWLHAPLASIVCEATRRTAIKLTTDGLVDDTARGGIQTCVVDTPGVAMYEPNAKASRR